jgi:hypothetical protein
MARTDREVDAALIGTPFGQAGGNTGVPTGTQATGTIAGINAPAPVVPPVVAPVVPPTDSNTPITGAGANSNLTKDDIAAIIKGGGAVPSGITWMQLGFSSGQEFANWIVGQQQAAKDPKKLSNGGTTATTATTLTAQQQSDRQNAIAALTAQFSAMGLGTDVAAAITAMVQQGYTADTISLIAQDPTSTNPLAIAMQTRFAGNAARVKAGLAPLSPAEYLATERSYRQVLSSAGLPSGFYDQTSDFTKFISQDISPTELKSRVDLASDAVTNADPFYRQSLQQQYGLSTGDMIAHVLDPSVALPILQKQAAAVSFGAEAQRQGLVVNNATAMLYGAQNISQAQAAQGFKTIAEMLPSEQALASRYTPEAAGNQMAALTADVFGGPNAGIAAANLKRLSTMETSAFGGSAGASQQGQSLGIGTQQGVQ